MCFVSCEDCRFYVFVRMVIAYYLVSGTFFLFFSVLRGSCAGGPVVIHSVHKIGHHDENYNCRLQRLHTINFGRVRPKKTGGARAIKKLDEK